MNTYANAEKRFYYKKKEGKANERKKIDGYADGRILLLAGLTGCGGANAKGGGAAASADDYPNGPVTIICPWGVGGGADVISRKISEVAKNYFDQPIIVENHTGASGTIGMMDAMDADADGYTMVLANGPLFSLTPKFIDVSYDLSDFTMLRGMRQVSLMILTNPQKSGMKTFDDLINYGKTHKITYATSSGPGGDQYVVSSAMFKALGIEAEPVGYGQRGRIDQCSSFRSGRLRPGYASGILLASGRGYDPGGRNFLSGNGSDSVRLK